MNGTRIRAEWADSNLCPTQREGVPVSVLSLCLVGVFLQNKNKKKPYLYTGEFGLNSQGLVPYSPKASGLSRLVPADSLLFFKVVRSFN